MIRIPTLIASAFLALFLLTSSPSNAWANVVQNLTIEQMSTRAEVIVHGRVLSVESGWNDSHTRIFTTIEIEVASYLAGSGPDVVVIHQAGGRVGETVHMVPGQPRFRIGDHVVVFLEPDGSGVQNRWVVLTMAAGVFRVAFDRLTGEAVLSRALDRVVRNQTPNQAPLAMHRVARPLLLRELTRRVTEARTVERVGGAR